MESGSIRVRCWKSSLKERAALKQLSRILYTGDCRHTYETRLVWYATLSRHHLYASYPRMTEHPDWAGWRDRWSWWNPRIYWKWESTGRYLWRVWSNGLLCQSVHLFVYYGVSVSVLVVISYTKCFGVVDVLSLASLLFSLPVSCGKIEHTFTMLTWSNAARGPHLATIPYTSCCF